MKKTILAVITAIVFVLSTTCASTGGGSSSLTLLDAVEEAAERIAGELPAGSRVAVVAFESDSDNLSVFIMEELVGALFDRKIEVADRENLPFLERELNFQLSGNVSDETMQSVGKFLGAELVITGQMRNLGSTYRFTANAIRVETAVHASIPRLTVRNDRDFQSMAAALEQQTTTIRTARYRITEQTDPQTAGTFLDRGLMFAGRGERDKAIADLSEAIRLNPNMAAAHFNRGLVYWLRGAFQRDTASFDLAIADFTEAIRLDPNLAQAYNFRGQSYLNKLDFDRALADYNQAIRLDPNYAIAYANIGTVYYMIEDFDRAVAAFTEAIRIDPKNVSTYAFRGDVYLQKQDFGLAIADWEVAARIDPNYNSRFVDDFVLMLVNQGNENIDKREFDNAIRNLTQAIQLRPNIPVFYDYRAYVYFGKGDFDRAIADWETVLRLEPNSPASVREGLEEARRRRGR